MTRSDARQNRSQVGSTLFLLVLFCGMLVAVGLIALMIGNAVSAHTTMKNDAERFALESALQLNSNDYAGRLNLLTGYSRELVFDSRQLYKKVAAESPELEGLAARLLAESRDGGRSMERERSLFSGYVINTLNQKAKEFCEHPETPLVAAIVHERSIIDLELGDIEGMPSNAPLSKANQALSDYDETSGYLQPGTDYYRPNVDLRLPDEDSDLSFRMSALPSYAEDKSDKANRSPSAAAIYSPTAFKHSAFLCKDGKFAVIGASIVPSAVRCHASAKVNMTTREQSKVRVTTTAATHGTNSDSQL